tara:strand:- start:208 stop:648 length:441 start_codon:yes stop_codon:yes gene_type:complete
MVNCDICGEPHKLKYVQKLTCGHCYHYECIQKSFMYDRKNHNQCPLCRKPHGLLPLINGLPKIIRGIHYISNYPVNYDPGKCTEIIKSGKRKGLECGCKCLLGFNICKRHHTSKLKREEKAIKNKKNINVIISDQVNTIQEVTINA